MIMTLFNYALCILALAALGAEAYLVMKRNRTIAVKGKDDFFTLCLVMLFAMLLLRPSVEADLVESLRNTLILMALFFSMGVKRGISVRGIEKLGYVIPWERIEAIQVAPYQMNKLMLLCTAGKRSYKLFFPKYRIKELVFEIQKYYPKVLLEESLKV
jgi:hypothetical protein